MSISSVLDRPSTLPAPLTTFVGREREAATVLERLVRSDVHLLTLTGPGGIGKTRLAIQVAEAATSAFPDGVTFVPLGPIGDPDLVLSTIARALGLRESPDQPLPSLVARRLTGQRHLLVLDNFEQVIAAAPMVAGLLAACPGSTALVTSRIALRVRAEHEFAVPPLSMGRGDDRREEGAETERRGEDRVPSVPPSPRPSVSSEAVTLFVQRASAIRPTFVLDAQNAAAIGEICIRLDGLPLAIELAAARIKILTPPALLARLSHRLDLLTGGARNQPARLQTMRDAIVWSYDLLTPEERSLFCRLAVFAGGFTLEAAEWVMGDGSRVTGGTDDPAHPSPITCHPSPSAALDLIAALVDHSLLQRGGEADGEMRLRMLETMREYGLEQLAAQGEADAVRRAHAVYFLTLAETAEPELWGRDQKRWLDRLEGEHDNLRTALSWCLETGEIESGLRLAAALWWFWQTRNHVAEGRQWLAQLLDRGADVVPVWRAKALSVAGVLAWVWQDYRQAERQQVESLAIWRALDLQIGVAQALFHLGLAAWRLDDVDRMAAASEECLAIFRELAHPVGIGCSLVSVGLVAQRHGRLEESLALIEQGIEVCGATGFDWGIAWALTHATAVARDLGDTSRAITLRRQSIALYGTHGDTWGVAEGLTDLAILEAEHGVPERAARLFGAAERLHQAIGDPAVPDDRAAYDRAVAKLPVALGQERFAAAWTAGQSLSLAQAVAEGAAVGTGPLPILVADRASATAHAGLTPRELDVLRLVARGASNQEIAAELFISLATAKVHVRNLFAKLGVTSRAQATAYAHRHGVV